MLFGIMTPPAVTLTTALTSVKFIAITTGWSEVYHLADWSMLIEVQSKGPDPKLTLYLWLVTKGIAHPLRSPTFLYGILEYAEIFMM